MHEFYQEALAIMVYCFQVASPPGSNDVRGSSDDLSRDEILALAQFGQVNQQKPSSSNRRPTETPRNSRPKPTRRPNPTNRPVIRPNTPPPVIRPNTPAPSKSPACCHVPVSFQLILECFISVGPILNGPLQCFSCGSLLDPTRTCDKFNNRDPQQVQTCAPNEACLLYAWEKSPTETCKMS